MTENPIERLMHERKMWRETHPYGFVARPSKNDDGTPNFMIWDCVVPGKEGTPWENGYYPLQLTFNNNYPMSPPNCIFKVPLYHLNIYSSGLARLPLLDEAKGWHPDLSIAQILLGIQQFLHEPNPEDPVQMDTFEMFRENRLDYEDCIRLQAAIMSHFYS